MTDLKETTTRKRQLVVIGICVLGFLLGGVNAVIPSIEAAETVNMETATFALG